MNIETLEPASRISSSPVVNNHEVVQRQGQETDAADFLKGLWEASSPTALVDEASPDSEAPSQQYGPLRDFIRNKMPGLAYTFSSVWHLVTAATLNFGLLADETRKKWAENATRFTKVINSLVYADLAWEALKNNFSFDFLGRIAEPIMNIFVDLNHYHLFRSFSSALNQLHSVNLPRVDKNASIWQNFMHNLEASKDFFMEVWAGKGGGFRKVLFGGENDKGHTVAFASHLQLVVGTLALLNGTKRNFLNRVLGVLRNVAGVVADIGLMFEKDPSAKRVGIFYLLHAVGDTIKRFTTDKVQDIIDNLIMPFYNAGLYNFGLMTRRQVDGTYISHKPATMAA